MVDDCGCVVIEGAAHGALCVTVTVLPATVIEPLRLVVPVLAATVKVVVPLPLPLAPVLIVIHALPLDALHEHALAAVIVTEPLPPFASKFNDVGDTVYVHGVTVTVAVVLSSVPQVLVMRTK